MGIMWLSVLSIACYSRVAIALLNKLRSFGPGVLRITKELYFLIVLK
jgi:hypothetical protein